MYRTIRLFRSAAITRHRASIGRWLGCAKVVYGLWYKGCGPWLSQTEALFTSDSFEIEPPQTDPVQKVNGHGKGKMLSVEEALLLFEGGFRCDRDRLLFGICYFTGCRISEALQLKVEHVDLEGRSLTFPGKILKGKNSPTRQVEISGVLAQLFEWYELPSAGYLFRAHAKAKNQGHLSRVQAHNILKAACERVGLTGVSTHSFRRSYISGLWRHGVPPHQIKVLTGHKSMTSLLEYVER